MKTWTLFSIVLIVLLIVPISIGRQYEISENRFILNTTVGGVPIIDGGEFDGNASSICGDGEVLLGDDGSACVNLNGTISDFGNRSYVEIIGDTMTGNLTMSGASGANINMGQGTRLGQLGDAHFLFENVGLIDFIGGSLIFGNSDGVGFGNALGGDADIVFDGTDLVIDPNKITATSRVIIDGSLVADNINLTATTDQVIFNSSAGGQTILQSGSPAGNILLTLPSLTGTLAALEIIQSWPASQNFLNTAVSIRIAENVGHVGDADSFIGFPAPDQFDITIGGIDFLDILQAGVDIVNWNPDQNDIDYRWETSGDASAMFLDGGTNNLGVGTENPTHKIEVAGTMNVSLNASFDSDVIITGTLFGGSPVKIAGIDITRDLFSLMDNINRSTRFTLQNLNNGTNASAVIETINDLGASMFFGIGSSNFLVGDVASPNITALISRSRGDMIFANSYNQRFIWYINPQDDNDLNNLVEVMRLDEKGLNITGNFSGNQIYGELNVHPDGNLTIVINSANVHENVTGFTNSQLNGFTLQGNDSLVADVSGRYMSNFWVSSSGGANKIYDACIVINGVHTFAHAHRRQGNAGDIGSMSGGSIISLNEGDTINLQIRNTEGTQNVNIFYAGISFFRIGD